MHYPSQDRSPAHLPCRPPVPFLHTRAPPRLPSRPSTVFSNDWSSRTDLSGVRPAGTMCGGFLLAAGPSLRTLVRPRFVDYCLTARAARGFCTLWWRNDFWKSRPVSARNCFHFFSFCLSLVFFCFLFVVYFCVFPLLLLFLSVLCKRWILSSLSKRVP